jgi:hypothetical protein
MTVHDGQESVFTMDENTHLQACLAQGSYFGRDPKCNNTSDLNLIGYSG